MLTVLLPLVAIAAGPDVIVSQIQAPGQYGSTADRAAFTATVTLCNLGNTPLNFMFLPDADHPVGVHNLYRWSAGRLVQIGQSWSKHEFCALQSNACSLGCIPQSCALLGIGCSTTSGGGLNAGPNLGSRGEIDPTTGFLDGFTANHHAGHTHSTISHGLQVAHADLEVPDARFFYEVLYVAADDAAAGNAANNSSHREVLVAGNPGQWLMSVTGPTVESTPVLAAWDGAVVDTLDTGLEDGVLHVATHVTALKGGLWRYEYAVANMTSARGVNGWAIPIGNAAISDAGFHAVASHDEGWSTAPWDFNIAGGVAEWSTAEPEDDPNANALRWGTQYNVWFVADAPPVPAAITLRRFAPGPGPDVVTLAIDAPASSAPCSAPQPPTIVTSAPPTGAIDARLPHAVDDATEVFAGWNTVGLTVDGASSDVAAVDFTISVVGGPATAIVDVVDRGAGQLLLIWDPPLVPRSRATLIHACSGTAIDLGYLPGDVDQDGFTSPLDILALIDGLNAPGSLPPWRGDLNRSVATTPTDILTLIDLLNGAGELEPWNGVSLPD